MDRYGQRAISYFCEVGLGPEFGDTRQVVRKWTGPVRVSVHGAPNAADREELGRVVDELGDLLGPSGPKIELAQEDANIEVHFAPVSKFPEIEPNYVPGNRGFFWTWWSADRIVRARILIDSKGISQEERGHLIREELTQSLGLMRDSGEYPDSIFFTDWTSTNEYAPVDRDVIRLLYDRDLSPGMTRSQFEEAAGASCG